MVTVLRRAVKLLFTDLCDIYETRPIEKEGRTAFEKIRVRKNIPCKISQKSYLFGESAANDRGDMSEIKRKVKLLVPPDCVIKPGSIVLVTRFGQKEAYKRSGALVRHASHNEVMVELAKDWA